MAVFAAMPSVSETNRRKARRSPHRLEEVLQQPFEGCSAPDFACLFADQNELAGQAPQKQATSSGAIHLEPPKRAMISTESGADRTRITAIPESLRD